MREKEKVAELPVFPGLSVCSGATGIPLPLLKQWKKKGCPAFLLSNRVDLAVLLKWLFAKDRESGDDSGADYNAELAKYKAKREKIKHDKEAKLVADKVETDAGIKSAMSVFFGELDRVFLSEFPPALKGLDELAIRSKAEVAIDRLKGDFKARMEELAKGEE